MADKKISQLPLLTNPSLNDVLVAVHDNVTYKVALQDLMAVPNSPSLPLPANSETFIVLAGNKAPDDDYYFQVSIQYPLSSMLSSYIGKTDAKNIPTLLMLEQLISFKSLILHGVSLPAISNINIPISAVTEVDWENGNIFNEQINDVLVIDSQRALAVTESGKIYKTDDGGANWTENYANSPSIPIKSLDQNQSVQFIDLVNPAQPGIFSFCATGGNYLYGSQDGGDTWTAYDMSVAAMKTNEQYISIAGSNSTYFLLGNKGSVVGINVSSVHNSDLSYTLTPSAILLHALPTGIYTGITVFEEGTAAAMITTLYVTGNDETGFPVKGVVYKSVDAGVTWTKIFEATNNKFNGLYFSDKQTGGIVGAVIKNGIPKGCLYKTSNGGISWLPIDLSSLNISELHDINFYGVGWAVGDNGTIIKSSDYGVTWVKDESFSETLNLLAVAVLPNGNAIVAAEDPGASVQCTIFYSNNEYSNGVTLTCTPVDTVWMKVQQADGSFKAGFVCALNATIKP